MNSFHVLTRHLNPGMAVVEIHGEMDIDAAPRAKEIMLGLLGEGYRNLIVNLRKTDYIDSTGLGMLIGILRRAREHGGAIRLVAPPNHVRRLFEITRLTYSLPIDASEEDAAGHFAG